MRWHRISCCLLFPVSQRHIVPFFQEMVELCPCAGKFVYNLFYFAGAPFWLDWRKSLYLSCRSGVILWQDSRLFIPVSRHNHCLPCCLVFYGQHHRYFKEDRKSVV